MNKTTKVVHAGSGPVNEPPDADFSYSITALENNTFQVQFNSASTDSDGSITGWLWEFGDGTLSLMENVLHNYTSAGTYTVNLTVTDDDGATDSTSKVITVPTGITTCEELQDMKNDLSGNYFLANDIDCSCTAGWNEGAGFEPIGNLSNPFTGTFDGRGHKITNLYINRPSTWHVGLFGCTGSGSEIRNVRLENVSVNGYKGVGSLVGHNKGIISNSYSSGSVNGDWYIGGLLGYNKYSTVEMSFSKCNVNGAYLIGGLLGFNERGTVNNSYSTGNVGGINRIGGLVGYNYYATVSNSYSTGSVTGSGEDIGGLIGYGGGATHSYWDIETSGQSSSAGGEGKTTAEMKQQATFVGWDFTNIWDIIEGVTYPYLQWEEAPALWTRYSPRIDNETQCLGVGGLAVDSEDNVIIASNRDVIKYDPNGNVLWEYDLCGCGVAVDKTDDSVVVGLCNSSIIKFSKTGSILWIEEL